jgi:hypothetical protein
MATQRSITFVIPTYGSDDVLKSNFLASPCLSGAHGHQILVQKDYPSAAKAYNEAIDRADNDLIVFAHQDMVFPETWPAQLERALTYLEASGSPWGVLGCFGVAHDGAGRGWTYHPTQGMMGGPFNFPKSVQTLDEIVLILRRSSGLRFDIHLPHFHLYGTDICLRAEKMGMKNYAVSAFCVHNGTYYPLLPEEFYESYRYIRKAWKDSLPLYTSCGTITRLQIPMYKKRLRETFIRHIQRRAVLTPRAGNGLELLRQIASNLGEQVN